MNLDDVNHNHITNNNIISDINDTNDSDDEDDLAQDAKRSLYVVYDAENNKSDGLSSSSSVAGFLTLMQTNSKATTTNYCYASTVLPFRSS